MCIAFAFASRGASRGGCGARSAPCGWLVWALGCGTSRLGARKGPLASQWQGGRRAARTREEGAGQRGNAEPSKEERVDGGTLRAEDAKGLRGEHGEITAHAEEHEDGGQKEGGPRGGEAAVVVHNETLRGRGSREGPRGWEA